MSTEISDKKIAETKLKEYGMLDRKKKTATDKQKQLFQELLELCEKHPEWFGGTKTVTLEVGQMSYVKKSVVQLSKDFGDDEWKAFQAKFPHLVKVDVNKSIPLKGLTPYLDDPTNGIIIEDMGVSIESVENFTVKPNK